MVSLNSEMYGRVDRFAKDLVAEGHAATVTIKNEQDILRLVLTSCDLYSNFECSFPMLLNTFKLDSYR